MLQRRRSIVISCLVAVLCGCGGNSHDTDASDVSSDIALDVARDSAPDTHDATDVRDATTQDATDADATTLDANDAAMGDASDAADAPLDAPLDGNDDAGTDGASGTAIWHLGDEASPGAPVLGRVHLPDASPTVLTTLGSVSAFEVTHDGRRIVFGGSIAAAGRFDLYSAAVDGSGITLLAAMTNPMGAVRTIHISPDDTRVAYIADADIAGQLDLFEVPLDASHAAVRISPARTSVVGQPFEFGWSRDSRRVAFAGAYTNANVASLFVVDVTAAMPTPVQVVPDADITVPGGRAFAGVATTLPPAWTAANTVLFAIAFSAGAPRRLCTAPASGASYAPLAHTPSGTDPLGIGTYGLSPDGTQVAFSMNASASMNAFEIYAEPADGSAAPARVTSGALSAASPAWSAGPNPTLPLMFSPDGLTIAYGANQNIALFYEPYAVPADGTSSEHRVAIVDAAAAADARGGVQQIAWSPDSAAFAYLASSAGFPGAEVFRVPSATVTDAAPILVEGAMGGGNVTAIAWTR